MGKSAPETPDYRGAAEATAESSKEVTDAQTWANRPHQTNPWGSTTWDAQATIDPATGNSVNKWTQNQTLNPESQAALDSQMAVTTGRSQMGEGMIGRTSNELGQPMDWDQFGQLERGATAEAIDMSDLPEGVGSVGTSQYDMGHDQYRQQAEDANYARSSARLDTRFGQSDEAMAVKLASQGLAPGDQAYDAAMKNYNDQKNDAYSSARNDAIRFGGEEASRNFGMDMQAGGQRYAERLGAGTFANQARQQSLNEQMGIKDRAYSNAQDEANNANALRTSAINEEQTRRQQSLNEMNAVLSGQQVAPATMAPVQMASRAAGTDYTGAMQDSYAADLNAANASNMGVQGMMNLGTSAMGAFSDRRLKNNIERIGTWLSYPLYKFQYIWGEWAVGVMSDEINQDAVSVHPSGFDIVDYMKVK
jgi:hypothetical protein